jgi:type III pantothenate kinase
MPRTSPAARRAPSLRESKKAIVIATGGFSEFVAKHSYVIQHIEPSLVLDGIRLIYERVEGRKKRKK